ncbi:MAG: UDP-2,3-diacylglucosamine diphosphatase [Thiomicrospira sp.]|uniref:UDP-2,3-diacylglucosamine diphosphatase n=1 Tax=Thiomicrospira sp. TaxID=935 RepID=UPI0019F72FC3|nr:UDP-2,3-diacylglucosamine diphosphatase [Thiomicrospira sp.]MBE0493785.1 UDP-2,3-diacylglucosamine diphosphatase [Thiomicrospira sp.]
MPSHPPHSYLLADVHLQPDHHHPINQAFISFISQQALQADSVYILGDLFETWVGDDLSIPLYHTEINALKKLTDSGTKLYIGYGNRDFLMRQAFWQASGAEFIEDETLAQIQGVDCLLLHGDSLCTDDKDYQRMRDWFRKPWVQWLFLHLPKKTRLNIAQKLRQQSGKQAQHKQADIMDVSNQAIEDLCARHPQVVHIIHGHTHRPAHHCFMLNGMQKQRWVLGDWRPETQIIKIINQHISLIKLD